MAISVTLIWENYFRHDLGKSFQTSSYTWHSLVEGYKLLQQGLEWEIVDGGNIRFWLDVLLWRRALMNLCPLAFLVADLRITVAEYHVLYPSWSNIPFVSAFSVDVVSKLQLVHLAMPGEEEDKLQWSFKSSALFSLRFIYIHMFSSPPRDQQAWLKVLKFRGPLRFSMLLWEVHRCCIKTQSLLAAPRIVVPRYYVSCVGILESDLHALWDYADAFVVWKAFLSLVKSWCYFSDADVVRWIDWSLSKLL